MNKLQLITRVDDVGSCRSAKEAILESVEAGIIKNVSFMAVGPEIEHAVELLGGREDIAYGFHVCLNAEWGDVKWGPLVPSPALIDENGYFLPFPNETKVQLESRGGIAESGIMPEVEAQLQKLRELGLPISYVDEHMGVSWIGFREDLAALSQRENLVYRMEVPSLPQAEFQGDFFLQLEERLSGATQDTHVWITHPGKDEPDMQNFNLAGKPKGVVAKERDAERRLLTDPRLPELFKKWNVKAVRYDEI